ncbi:hypothetical protein AGMMS49545_11970 [Betaproteobacteria bacterium]|nr:hypothetical protein AGMMS49545_11970 [Betaproteobacteria bacterium]GHU42588.1 hypothetical protein AGMMS50289_07550 [Betaproteobacteria bacterium]
MKRGVGARRAVPVQPCLTKSGIGDFISIHAIALPADALPNMADRNRAIIIKNDKLLQKEKHAIVTRKKIFFSPGMVAPGRYCSGIECASCRYDLPKIHVVRGGTFD